MYFTLNQAAKECGKSAGTLSKAVKSGKLSVAEKNEDGSFKIDPSELFRVFPKQQETPINEQLATSKETGATPREIEFLQQMNSQQAETIADLRKRLDEERDERQKLSIMMIEYQKPINRNSLNPVQTEDLKTEPKKGKRKWWGGKIK